uniref:NHL repeat containing protein n=1 Tax=mine drainage metagenome TaxID=410659 RepID=E6Q088_9ZZZZ
MRLHLKIALILSQIMIYGLAIGRAVPNQVGASSGPFATALLSPKELDQRAITEWVGGQQKPYANPGAVQNYFWTQTAGSNYGQIIFGVSTQPGWRHLRVGFTNPIEVGSILVRGGGAVSVLRPGVPYPGDPGNDSDWIAATRLVSGQPAHTEVDAGGFAVWVLPAVTSVRAIRFSHLAALTDADYSASVGGVYLLKERLENVAPTGVSTASANGPKTPLLIDEQYNDWNTWDNGPLYQHLVNEQTPEWVMLSWPSAVKLRGLAALWAGYDAADVEVFTGGPTLSPRDAPESAWRAAGPKWLLHSQYTRSLGVDWYDFGQDVTTRAVRVRITQVTDEFHPHLVGKTMQGRRVWLGELMALRPMGELPQQTMTVAAVADAGPHPPIPVRFTLRAPGYVTLVIEDAQGNRVRNLVSDTWFPAGENVAWWDGSDDLSRDEDAAGHGQYRIPTHFLPPGQYHVRGLVHQQIDLRYEFSLYTGGNPAWDTVDGKGGWLTNHTPPSAALFVPAGEGPVNMPLVFLGSYTSEGGSGLAWVDLTGKKQGGRGWVGGAWTAAPFPARDSGSLADKSVYAYVGAAWSADGGNPQHPQAVVRLTGLTLHADRTLAPYHYDPGATLAFRGNHTQPYWNDQMGGLAVYNRLLAYSLTKMNRLVLEDADTGAIVDTISLDSPRGVAFDHAGRLLVLSGVRLLRYDVRHQPGESRAEVGQAQTVITSGLEDPAGITLDDSGNVYISDHGSSHQVKIYNPEGRLERIIGHPGTPKAGPYDPLHMNDPAGMAVDSEGHLWVTEDDYQPKRVSVWNQQGQLLRAFYGPARYGGGGVVDGADPTHFYYNGMDFRVNWQSGTNQLSSVPFLIPNEDMLLPIGGAAQLPTFCVPYTPVHWQGNLYFSNSYQNLATTGVPVGCVFEMIQGVLHPVAAMGRANQWPLLATERYRSLWPAGVSQTSMAPQDSVLFSWSDRNGNGEVDPNELTLVKSITGSITMMPDMSLLNADVNGNVTQYSPASWTAEHAPIYDLAHARAIASGAQLPREDGGGQALLAAHGVVMTTAPLPFSMYGVGGVDFSGHRWSYPSLWPGLHIGHVAPIANHRGELIATTQLLGGLVDPPGENVGQLWAINGNTGDVYLFTADGLYVTQLFQDVRTGQPWKMPVAQRNMLLNGVSLHDENFFPSITQTPDGKVYLDDGGRTSLVRLDGLDTLRALDAPPVTITTDTLKMCASYEQGAELARQKLDGSKELRVAMKSALDLANLNSTLNSAEWVVIDERVNQVGWSQIPNVTEGALATAGGRLYAAYRSEDANLLKNSGTIPDAPFKTGGALDLMIGTNPAANPNRSGPVAGDLRLLVYLVNGEPRATLYRAVVPGTARPVPFSSPWQTIYLDQVVDVTKDLQFVQQGGNYAFSIPLSVLGLRPRPGERIRADIGVLRGDGQQTTERVYWSNKATNITSDVPSEAELTPNLWGEWVFMAQ